MYFRFHQLAVHVQQGMQFPSPPAAQNFCINLVSDKSYEAGQVRLPAAFSAKPPPGRPAPLPPLASRCRQQALPLPSR